MKKSNTALTALGDPTRQEIITILSKGPLPVNKIAEKLPVSRPAVSKHLKILTAAGLVAHESLGTRNLYRLHANGLDGLREYLDALWDTALNRYKLLADNTNGLGK